MSVYYTKTEMESLYAGKLCSNAIETESYTIKIDSPIATDGMITFKRFMIGLVMIYFNLPNLSASPTGGYVQILSASDFPRKFRPDRDMYFMTADIDNNPRCVGILAENGIKIYASTSSGCYGVVSFIGTPMTSASMVSYYCDPAYEAVTAINDKNDEDWESFLVVTDTHGNENAGNSQNVIRFILENSKVKMCYWLGDTMPYTNDNNKDNDQWNDTNKVYYYNIADVLLPVSNKVCFANGNHDRTTATGVTGLVVDMFNDFICDKFDRIKEAYTHAYGNVRPDGVVDADIESKILKWAKQYYYFTDDPDKSTRYMVINTSQTGKLSLDTETQKKWIEKCVQFTQNNWKLVVFGHINIDVDPYPNPVSPYVAVWGNSRIQDEGNNQPDIIRKAIGSTNGTVVGYFCGHQHLDYATLITAAQTNGKKIPERILLSDQRAYYEGPYNAPTSIIRYPNDRNIGTVNEQAFTIISINHSSGDVEFRRIGAVTSGVSMDYNYITCT